MKLLVVLFFFLVSFGFCIETYAKEANSKTLISKTKNKASNKKVSDGEMSNTDKGSISDRENEDTTYTEKKHKKKIKKHDDEYNAGRKRDNINGDSLNIFIEPAVNYHYGSLDWDCKVLNVNVNFSGKGSGPGGNLKAGVSYNIFYAAMDAYYAKIHFGKLKATVNGQETESSEDLGGTTMMAFGPLVGITIPAVPITFNIGYLFYDKLKNKDGDTLSGSAFKLGLGFIVPSPKLTIRLDYIMHTYSENKNKSTGTTTKFPATISGVTFEKPKYNAFVLSVGYWFDLLN